jgi:hypothetical protein
LLRGLLGLLLKEAAGPTTQVVSEPSNMVWEALTTTPLLHVKHSARLEASLLPVSNTVVNAVSSDTHLCHLL